MLLSKSILAILLSSLLSKATEAGYVAGDDWSTLLPTGDFLSGAATDYTSTFGIAIQKITSSISLTAASPSSTTSNTRNYAQIITQISDGQIQASTATVVPKQTVSVVSQISDGQIQNAKTAPIVITQIGDGQIQASSPKRTASSSSEETTTHTVKTTMVTTAVRVVDCVSSSSTEEDTTTIITLTPTTTVVTTVGSRSGGSSSSDDITTTLTVTPTTLVVVTVTESDVASATPTSSLDKRDAILEACLTDQSLAMTLESAILLDKFGRVGSIVANRQFQFDGPPQAGAIYAAGWSVVDGKLALGDQTTFYQCLSGDFYNVYDEMIGMQCEAVYLNVVDLVSC